jgi:uncharacterized protein (DUF302 family)
MTQATAQASFASRTIAVEHVKISSQRSFAEVRRRLEDTLPKLDVSITEVLRSGDQKRATAYEENGPTLSIFEQRDHGSLLQTFGGRRNALQYEIGNPLTASKMTRHQLSAALYAPLRVVLFEDEQGKGVGGLRDPNYRLPCDRPYGRADCRPSCQRKAAIVHPFGGTSGLLTTSLSSSFAHSISAGSPQHLRSSRRLG